MNIYTCSACEREFNSQQPLNAHQISHKNIKRTPSESNAKVVCCIYHKEEMSLRTFNNQLKRIKTCVQCNCEYKVHVSIDVADATFCSQSCSTRFNNLKRGVRVPKPLKSIKRVKPKVVKSRPSAKPQIAGPYSKLFSCTCSHCEVKFVSRAVYKYCNDHRSMYKSDNRNIYKFTFNVYQYPELFDLDLINSVGFYAPGGRSGKWNLNGLSRDHRVSVNEAIKNNYDPYYIKHPMNCELMTHSENNKKKQKSSITFNELVELVDSYDRQNSD